MIEAKKASCRQQVDAEIDFDITTRPYESKVENFSISMDDGLIYHGNLTFTSLYIICHVSNVKTLIGSITMSATNDEIKYKKIKVDDDQSLADEKDLLKFNFEDSKILKGQVYLTFEPAAEKEFEKNLMNYFTFIKYKPTIENQYDIKLEVNGREFEFNRASLSKVSSTFKDMFELSNSTEGNLLIEDACACVQTIKTFACIMKGSYRNPFYKWEITMDLYNFADKYDIQPIAKACLEYFTQTIAKENMCEMAIIANRTDDENFSKNVARFITENSDEDTKKFFQQHPEYNVKLFQSLL